MGWKPFEEQDFAIASTTTDSQQSNRALRDWYSQYYHAGGEAPSHEWVCMEETLRAPELPACVNLALWPGHFRPGPLLTFTGKVLLAQETPKTQSTGLATSNSATTRYYPVAPLFPHAQQSRTALGQAGLRSTQAGLFTTLNCQPLVYNDDSLRAFRHALLPCWRWVDD